MILDDIFFKKEGLTPSEVEQLSAKYKKRLWSFNIMSIITSNIAIVWVGEFSIVFLIFSIVGFLPIILFIALKLSAIMAYVSSENVSSQLKRFNYFTAISYCLFLTIILFSLYMMYHNIYIIDILHGFFRWVLMGIEPWITQIVNSSI